MYGARLSSTHRPPVVAFNMIGVSCDTRPPQSILIAFNGHCSVAFAYIVAAGYTRARASQ